MNIVPDYADVVSADGFVVYNTTNTFPNNITQYVEVSKPIPDPLYVTIPITIIYGTIFLTGIIGNISTCIVIARNKHMHTATNYYLFSLAISDLLLLLWGMPQEIVVMWSTRKYIFGEVFCILQSYAAETSANATVLTITAFTVERYVAICHPFQSHTLSKLSRAVKFVIAIWVLALCLAIPQAIQFGVQTEYTDPDDPDSVVYLCTLKNMVIQNAFVISTWMFFVTPMTIITVLYVLIGLKLRRSRLIPVKRPSVNSDRGAGDVSRHRTTTSQSHVIKMLIAVVVAFFICWAPFHAQRLVAMYGHLNENPGRTIHFIYNFLTYSSGVMYYLSTTINPLLYHIMSHKFREAFKSTLAQLCGGKRRKNAAKKKLYTALSHNHRLEFYNQNGGNIVLPLEDIKNNEKKSPMNGNAQQITISVPNQEAPVLQRQMSIPVKPIRHTESPGILFTNPINKESKILKIKERDQLIPRSRGSSNSSQLTLTTSYGKGDDEGNNNQTCITENILMHSQSIEPKCNGKSPSITETDVDSNNITDGMKNNNLNAKRKVKCTCLNCEKGKRGIASLTNKCLFKSKSQAATLGSIAKKIRLLPNATRNKFSKDCENKNGDLGKDSKKLTKTLSSNTISNSSLQDLDESEFTSSELADIMGQMKNNDHVQC